MAGIYNPDLLSSPRPLHQRAGFIVEGPTGEEIPFGRVVFLSDGAFMLSNPLIGLWSGLNVSNKTQQGKVIFVLTTGPVESQDWTESTGTEKLVPLATYFLQADGKLDTIVPDEGAIVRVGRAASETILNLTFDLKVN